MMRPTQGPVFVCREPVDFRLAINGLSLLVEQHLAMNPFASALYVFSNRHKNRIKILYWEKNGFCLWQKRLEQDRFHWPAPGENKTVTLSAEELNWLLDGFDLWRNKPHHTLHFASVS